MKTLHNWKIQDESFDRQSAAGRHNPGQELLISEGDKVWNQLTIPISCGTSDDVHIFTQDEGNIIVLVVNLGLWYCGLEVFDNRGKVGPLNNRTFLQVDYHIREVLGPKELDLAPITIAKKLYNYLYDR